MKNVIMFVAIVHVGRTLNSFPLFNFHSIINYFMENIIQKTIGWGMGSGGGGGGEGTRK